MPYAVAVDQLDETKPKQPQVTTFGIRLGYARRKTRLCNNIILFSKFIRNRNLKRNFIGFVTTDWIHYLYNIFSTKACIPIR